MNATQQTQEQLAAMRQEARGDSMHHLPAVPQEIAALKERIVELESERDGMSHDLKQVREALGCDGSDLTQLLGAIDGLMARIRELRSELRQVNGFREELSGKYKQKSDNYSEAIAHLEAVRWQLAQRDALVDHMESRLKEAEELLDTAGLAQFRGNPEWCRRRDAFVANKQK